MIILLLQKKLILQLINYFSGDNWFLIFFNVPIKVPHCKGPEIIPSVHELAENKAAQGGVCWWTLYHDHCREMQCWLCAAARELWPGSSAQTHLCALSFFTGCGRVIFSGRPPAPWPANSSWLEGMVGTCRKQSWFSCFLESSVDLATENPTWIPAIIQRVGQGTSLLPIGEAQSKTVSEQLCAALQSGPLCRVTVQAVSQPKALMMELVF